MAELLQPEVDILLSAYNGERFIGEQIDSILNQHSENWRLMIRDDGSTDRTKVICETYAKNNSSRITILGDSAGNLGVVQSFGQLLGHSTAPYVMFCDQDDIWLPEKVEFQLAKIKEREATRGGHFPIAMFTDALVVDAELRPIASSLLKHINRNSRWGQRLNRLCIEGNTYGCTMIFNRALVDRVGEIPAGVISHDWWCSMVASVFGELAYSDYALLKHRRHGSNSSATKKNSLLRYILERPSLIRHRQWVHRVLMQCESFDRKYSKHLEGEAKRLFADLVRMRQANWFLRRYLIIRNRIWMTGFWRNLGYFLSI